MCAYVCMCECMPYPQLLSHNRNRCFLTRKWHNFGMHELKVGAKILPERDSPTSLTCVFSMMLGEQLVQD